MRMAIFCLFAILLAGCKHTPPLTEGDDFCELKYYVLEQPLPGEAELTSIFKGSDLPPRDMLMLSGGSQNGAFGAGFLEGWKTHSGMPDFSLVTGVSTGALLSTGAFIGRPEIMTRNYTIDAESDLLDSHIGKKGLDDGLGSRALIAAMREGAISDLAPLRRKIVEILGDETILADVASRYDPDPGKGAYLLVGATDVDLGRAVAFDLTELAHRYVEARAEGRAGEADRLKGCYADALVASSIVPPGAKPVFIDNRMYIDGGVRYAVFDDRVREVIETASPRIKMMGARSPRLFIILNGSGDTKVQCGKVDEAHCTPEHNPVGQHEDWDLLSLALRSVDLLTGQVKRLSVNRVETRGQDLSGDVYFARIRSEELATRPYAIPDFDGERSCRDWEALDDAHDRPIEFHKRYMRCLIAYGRDRAGRADWNLQPKRAVLADR